MVTWMSHSRTCQSHGTALMKNKEVTRRREQACPWVWTAGLAKQYQKERHCEDTRREKRKVCSLNNNCPHFGLIY